jgi:hypothetical protein
MQISLGESICQEFSDVVLVSHELVQAEDRVSNVIQEIKCCISVNHFPDLMYRMTEIGYAMVQVQKDRTLKKCFVWFEPASEDITLIDEIEDEDEDEPSW